MTERRTMFIIECPYCQKDVGLVKTENTTFDVKKVVNKK